jgi:hypothetical protein
MAGKCKIIWLLQCLMNKSTEYLPSSPAHHMVELPITQSLDTTVFSTMQLLASLIVISWGFIFTCFHEAYLLLVMFKVQQDTLDCVNPQHPIPDQVTRFSMLTIND